MCVNIDFFAINIFQPKRELTLVNIFFFRAMLGKHKCGLTFTSEINKLKQQHWRELMLVNIDLSPLLDEHSCVLTYKLVMALVYELLWLANLLNWLYGVTSMVS